LIEASVFDYRRVDGGHRQWQNWPTLLRSDPGSVHLNGFSMNLLRRSLVLAFVTLLSACAGNPMPGQATAPGNVAGAGRHRCDARLVHRRRRRERPFRGATP
jgi:hypothetical protein